MWPTLLLGRYRIAASPLRGSRPRLICGKTHEGCLQGIPSKNNLDKIGPDDVGNDDLAAIGMKTMDQSLQALVQKQVVSIEVARAKARQPDAITA